MAISSERTPSFPSRRADEKSVESNKKGSPKLTDQTKSHVDTQDWEDAMEPRNAYYTIPQRDGSQHGHLPSMSKISNVLRGTFKDKMKGGLADHMKPSDFDSKQLAKGVKVEMEHTTDKAKAKEIAMDHLEEHPNYYKELEKMENKMEKKSMPLSHALAGSAILGTGMVAKRVHDNKKKMSKTASGFYKRAINSKTLERAAKSAMTKGKPDSQIASLAKGSIMRTLHGKKKGAGYVIDPKKMKKG